MEEIGNLFAIGAPADRVRGAPGEPVRRVDGFYGELLRDGRGTNKSGQKDRKKKPLHRRFSKR
jgi:hypothetical protein